MFIPVNAKADIQGSKKGKISPAQNAMVNAIALNQQTGIFDALSKCEAEFGSRIGNDFIVVFSRGYFTICGRLVEVEKGSEVKIPVPVQTYTGNIVASFDLAGSGESEFTVKATSEVLIQQDLNENPYGRYDFVLYSYTASPSGVSLHPRDESIYIPTGEKCVYPLGFNNRTGKNQPWWHDRGHHELRNANDITEGESKYKDYSSGGAVAFVSTERESSEGPPQANIVLDGKLYYNEGKHAVGESAIYAADEHGNIIPGKTTIENRINEVYKMAKEALDRVADMGFSQGSVTGISGASLTRIGKYAILNLPSVEAYRSQNINLYLSFAPAESFSLTIYGSEGGTGVLAFTEGSTDVTYRITGTSSSRSVFPEQQIGYKVV